MNISERKSKSPHSKNHPGVIWLLLLAAVVACFFCRVFAPDWVVFSNDGPLGIQESNWLRLPQSFLGQWYDLNAVGGNAGASLADLSNVIRWIVGPLGYAKFSAPLSLWILGLGACFFCRRSGMGQATSVLCGLSACLTTSYFSN